MKSKIHIFKKTIKIIVRKKIILLSATLSLSALVVQSQITYDVFTYTEPVGYKKETGKDYISYTKTDAKTSTYCIISVYKQNPSTGDIKKDFENDWQDIVVKSLRIRDTPKADNSDDINVWKTYSGAANFEFNSGTSMALLTTAKKDNANVAILIVTNAQTFFTTDVDAFFGKLKLGNPKTANINTNINKGTNNTTSVIVAPSNTNGFSVNGNGIVGVWMALTDDLPLTGLSFKWRVFFTNGKTIYNLPSKGLYNYNGTKENYFDITDYTFNNNVGAIGKESKLQLVSIDKLKIGSNTYFKCSNVTGVKFEGSYCLASKDYIDQNNIRNGAKSIIHFKKDGTFNDEGLWATFLENNSDNIKPENAPGKGAYELKDFTLILKYSDGRVRYEPFNFTLNTTSTTNKMIFVKQIKLYKLN
jgi:hypothetical protein